MSTFRDRIAGVGEAKMVRREVARYNTMKEIPLVRIMIHPGYVSYEDMEALISADGAPIAATSPGQWGQLYAAGRM